MTKYDYNWCKPDAEMRPVYCPIPLSVVIHRHDEWDEPVVDPETGEPTGETEHKTSDWDEVKTVLHPSDAEKELMGYKRLYDNNPGLHEQGKHYERTDKIEADGADGYRWVYALVDDPPPPQRTFDKYLLVDALMKAGAWERVKAWLQSMPDAYDRAVMAPDISEDEPLLADGIAAAKEAFGWTDADVEELLAKCVKEGT